MNICKLLLQIPSYYLKLLYKYILLKLHKRDTLKERYIKNYKLLLEVSRSNERILAAKDFDIIEVVVAYDIPPARVITKDTLPTECKHIKKIYRKIVSYEEL